VLKIVVVFIMSVSPYCVGDEGDVEYAVMNKMIMAIARRYARRAFTLV